MACATVAVLLKYWKCCAANGGFALAVGDDMNTVKTACEEATSPTQIVLRRATLPRIGESKTSTALSIFIAVLGALWMGEAWQLASQVSFDLIGETRHFAAAAWFVGGALVCGTGVLVATLLKSTGRLRTVVTLIACALVCASFVGVLISSILLARSTPLEVQAGATGLLAATFLGCCGFASLAFRFRAHN